jgi:hypothetical protein
MSTRPTDTLRDEIESLERELCSDKALTSIEVCDLQIRYWRKQQALASMETRTTRTAKSERPANATERKQAELRMRHASDQMAQWAQRKSASLKVEGVETLQRLEQTIAKKHAAAAELAKIRT